MDTPTIGPDPGGTPYTEEHTPVFNAIQEWLGHREDPHIEIPEYPTEATP
jgi:hypothetical protein